MKSERMKTEVKTSERMKIVRMKSEDEDSWNESEEDPDTASDD